MMGRVVRAVAVAVQVAKSSFSVSVESVNRIVLYRVQVVCDKATEIRKCVHMYTTRVRKHVVRVALLTYMYFVYTCDMYYIK